MRQTGLSQRSRRLSKNIARKLCDRVNPREPWKRGISLCIYLISIRIYGAARSKLWTISPLYTKTIDRILIKSSFSSCFQIDDRVSFV
jgi:hypothetical protein